jgi:hypothetical protein
MVGLGYHHPAVIMGYKILKVEKIYIAAEIGE